MWYLLAFLLGFLMGGLGLFAILESRFVASQKLKNQSQQLAEHAERVGAANTARSSELDARDAYLAARYSEYEQIFVSYGELQNENFMLKRDLRNVDVELRKSKLDGEQSQKSRELLHEKIEDVGRRYLEDSLKWLRSTLNQNNYVQCKQRLAEVILRCREMGLSVPESDEVEYVAELKAEFERVVRIAIEREEQARIKAQIREELQLERERQAEIERLNREQEVIKTALQRALADANDQHSAEIEELKARLAEAEEKSVRAISQAQLTKAGHVYVISNIGSFGENVFKIGMTRRLEPGDRVAELSGASVPFPFDVHMMISSRDAPALENALHRAFRKHSINKANPRKEFFKVEIEEINRVVRAQHGVVEYVADAAALEYRQSLSMSDEDLDYISQQFGDVDDETTDSTAAR